MRSLSAACFCSAVLLGAPGCADPQAATLDMGAPDAGPRDGGSLDGRVDGAAEAGAPDGGSADGSLADAGTTGDADLDAARDDASTSDAGPSDAGSSDGGLTDAFASPDAALRDAALVDSATTSCAIGVAPSMVVETDAFELTIDSNGAGCTLRLDASTPLSVPCSITASVAGTLLGAGTHTLELSVGSGPSGPTTCATSVVVVPAPDAGPRDAGPGVTTCSVSSRPPSGTTADTFTLTGASNGSSCTASVDGSAALSVPCNATFDVSFPAGTHTVTLSVAAGPSGPTTCSASVVVTEAPDAGVSDAGPGDSGVTGTTTCTLDVSPPSGSGATTFTITAASNGSMCSGRLDGNPVFSTPCSGTSTVAGSLLGPGTHTLELIVGAGPGGATTCSDVFTITP